MILLYCFLHRFCNIDIIILIFYIVLLHWFCYFWLILIMLYLFCYKAFCYHLFIILIFKISDRIYFEFPALFSKNLQHTIYGQGPNFLILSIFLRELTLINIQPCSHLIGTQHFDHVMAFRPIGRQYFGSSFILSCNRAWCKL